MSHSRSTQRGKSVQNEPIGMIEHERKILEKIQYRQVTTKSFGEAHVSLAKRN